MKLSENTNVTLTIGTIVLLGILLVGTSIRIYQDEQDIKWTVKRLRSLEQYCKAKFQIDGKDLSEAYLKTHSWYDE